jgi:ABC-type spermidine/putrescine transport system permease subunit I
VILPTVLPALLTGFALAFARAVGEYGSVIFIAGNMPMVSEIAPLMIITKLEQYDYAGATSVAVVMLVASVHPAARDQPPASGGRGRYYREQRLMSAVLDAPIAASRPRARGRAWPGCRRS